ncbi:hypothetical protein VIGAN_07099800 [Vigna angularis var. angularis]|uniref:C3H1-type domain-containing protein n=1 Tax=Vigna angularis var. angularis TaxID=157739 RepID=A0A0S3SHM0_PHAAN|nr:hypothetical protein VIGAN_07099800 [Vigna angularis var. angularis]
MPRTSFTVPTFHPSYLFSLFSLSLSASTLYNSQHPFLSLHIHSLFLSSYSLSLSSFKVLNMSSVCSDHHKFHPSHQFLSPNKTLREIDVPPRKLLTCRAAAACGGSELFSADTMLQKFLPSNNLDDSDEDDPYSADHFRMFEFKVRRCTRSRSHDWTDCPFAHPGEKARRRDPRRYHYSGTVCPEYRRGGCNRGDACEFAHGVFECWLHPARYRTEACKDGKNCKRKIQQQRLLCFLPLCFFFLFFFHRFSNFNPLQHVSLLATAISILLLLLTTSFSLETPKRGFCFSNFPIWCCECKPSSWGGELQRSLR